MQACGKQLEPEGLDNWIEKVWVSEDPVHTWKLGRCLLKSLSVLSVLVVYVPPPPYCLLLGDHSVTKRPLGGGELKDAGVLEIVLTRYASYSWTNIVGHKCRFPVSVTFRL